MARHIHNYETEIVKILSRIDNLSESSFEFDGQKIAVGSTRSNSPQLPQAPAFVADLQTVLYRDCYCHQFHPGTLQETISTPLGVNGEFLKELSQSNRSTSRWDLGWRVENVDPSGRVSALKGAVNRIFSPGEYVSFNMPGSQISIGDSIGVFIIKESTTAQPGFYFAFSEAISATGNLDIVRYYWNINSFGVGRLFTLITESLNRFQVPFQLKCPVYREAFTRRDSAVLYVHKRFHSVVRRLAEKWQASCEEFLRDGTPLFTLAIYKGVGIAEDPETGESFGMNRCRILSEAIWDTHKRGLPKPDRAEAIEQYFKRNRVDLDRPYLKPGSADLYHGGN
jgi:HopA1 effector protein family